MIFQKNCSNCSCIIRPLKLTILSCRYSNQMSVVAMVTGLPSYFLLSKARQFNKDSIKLYCGVNRFSIREVMMIQRE